MTTTLSQPASKTQILFRYTAWEFWRNIRMIESAFFVVVLPAAMYLMFGVGMNQGQGQASNGNVPAYVMTSMAVYGAVVATTAMAGTAAVERDYGWGRQLSMTGLSNAGYFTGKTLMSVGVAVMPILVVFALGLVTGAELDGTWRWFATGALTLLVALPFALYGMAIALIFRSETAVSAASGLLVVFAFFGNLFVPLSGTLLRDREVHAPVRCGNPSALAPDGRVHNPTGRNGPGVPARVRFTRALHPQPRGMDCHLRSDLHGCQPPPDPALID